MRIKQRKRKFVHLALAFSMLLALLVSSYPVQASSISDLTIAGGGSPAQAEGIVPDVCSTVTDVPQAECLALEALYNSTGGSSWAINTDWLATTTVCSWFGITCSGGNVSEINLYYNNLTGALGVDFSIFTQLTWLDLAGNSLSGDISTIIGTLPAGIGWLDLGYNAFTGAVPSTFSGFSTLQALIIPGNSLTGDLSTIINDLPASIEILDIENTAITGTIPSTISNLTNFRGLGLGNLNLTGDMTTIIGYLQTTNMMSLFLDNNQFTGTIPSTIANLPLDNIDVSGNPGMSGNIPTNIINLALSEFRFDGTSLCEPPGLAYGTWASGISTYSGTGLVCLTLFTDDFESGDFSAWTRYNDGGGYLYTCLEAALMGSHGACVERGDNDKRKQLIDNSPGYQTSFAAQFAFDINGLSMTQGERFRFMQFKMSDKRPAFLVMRFNEGQHYIQLVTKLDDLTNAKTGWYLLSDTAHIIEVDWQASTAPGADDGFAALYIDDVLQETLTGLDNDTHYINSFRMGFTSRLVDKTISGIFYIDDVITNNSGHIGAP